MPEVAELLATVELYASGVGLMLYSPGDMTRLEPDCDYMPVGGNLQPPLDGLVRDHQVVMLGTGSPQLDYRVRVFKGAPDASAQRSAAGRVGFGLRIDGGALCIRDGYDAMEWAVTGASLRMVPVADGGYVVHALWLPTETAMLIELYLEPSSAPPSGDGWPLLEYRARQP